MKRNFREYDALEFLHESLRSILDDNYPKEDRAEIKKIIDEDREKRTKKLQASMLEKDLRLERTTKI